MPMPTTIDPRLQAALDVVPALTQVPHLEEYFGVWAMHEPTFRAAVDTVGRMDLAEHIRHQFEIRHTDETPGETAVRVPNGYSYSVTDDGVAILSIAGTMMKFASSIGQSTSTVMMRRTVRSVARDDRVKRVVLHIDSPGGTVAGTRDLADDVAELNTVKPVTAYIDSLGASAAYYVASQASRIVAGADALVGSIGVFTVVADYSAFAAKEGVKVHVVRAGKFKGMAAPGTEIQPEQLAEFQRIVDGFYSQFTEAVARGRKMPMERVLELSDGRVHLAEDAQRLGIIDAVQRFDQVIRELSSAASSRRTNSTSRAEVGAPAATQENTMPDSNTPHEAAQNKPRPATLAELKAAFPSSSAEFREQCIEQGMTMEQAARHYADTLQAALENRERELAELKAQQAQQQTTQAKKPGVPALGIGASTGSSPAEGGGAIERFNTAVEAKVKAGMKQQEAVKAVCREDPELREAYVAEYNNLHRGKRQAV